MQPRVVAADLTLPGTGASALQRRRAAKPEGHTWGRFSAQRRRKNSPRSQRVGGHRPAPKVTAIQPPLHGNRTQQSFADGQTVTTTYDVENRLVAVSGGRNATLRYDPLGRLYEVSGSATTRFLYDGDALAMEYGADGTLLRRYIHGADLKADDPIAWYEGSGFASTNERILRPDWQGSIVAVADSGGTNMVAVNRYDEYGIPQPTNSGRFQYTGQAFVPELGMYYYKARFYSPTMGRFLQTDPIGYKDQINLYAYVGNDPVDRGDPSGLRKEWDSPFDCAGEKRSASCAGLSSIGDFPPTSLAQGAITTPEVEKFYSNCAADGDPYCADSGLENGKVDPGTVVSLARAKLEIALLDKYGKSSGAMSAQSRAYVSTCDQGCRKKIGSEMLQIRIDLARNYSNWLHSNPGKHGDAGVIYDVHAVVWRSHGLNMSSFMPTLGTGRRSIGIAILNFYGY